MNHFIMEHVANGAVCKEKIIFYLDLVKDNINLSAMNQALLYFQNPKASAVCGRAAWEAMGRNIKKDAVPIVLYLPEITRKDNKEAEDDIKTGIDSPRSFRAVYKAVNVFDVSATEGAEMPVRASPEIMERIIEATGATTEVIEKEVIRNPMDRGFYDRKLHTFFLEKGMDSKEQEATLLSLFVEYEFSGRGIDDRLLELAVKYVLLERYGLEHRIREPLFTRLDTYDGEARKRFVMGLSLLSADIAQVIEGRWLSFEETAYVNCLFDIDDKGEIICRCMKAAENAEDEILSDSLRRFGEKLMYAEEDVVRRLCWMRSERRLFSYPPVML